MNFKKIIATFSLLALMFSTPIIPTSVSNAAPSCPRCGGIVRSGSNHSCCDVLGHNYVTRTTKSTLVMTKSHAYNGRYCNYQLWLDHKANVCSNCGHTGSTYTSNRELNHSLCGK